MRKPGLGPMLSASAGIVIALWVTAVFWHSDAVEKALATDGYGEHVTGAGDPKACPFGAVSTAFLAQGSRQGREAVGHVCTSFFAAATVTKEPLGANEALDWH